MVGGQVAVGNLASVFNGGFMSGSDTPVSLSTRLIKRPLLNPGNDRGLIYNLIDKFKVNWFGNMPVARW